MNCAELEILLCDYLDGALEDSARHSVEAHLAACSSCAELARDAGAALRFAAALPAVEPPPELVTRILFHTGPGAGRAPSSSRSGQRPARGWLAGWLQPLLQPRFAMGMAMTILSFSLVGRFAGMPQRQLTAADLDPVKVFATFDDKVHRAWNRAVKYYDNLRFVYEFQARLREWSLQEEEDRKAQSGPATIIPAPSRERSPRRAGQEQGRESQ